MRAVIALAATLAIVYAAAYVFASVMLRHSLFFPEKFPAGEWDTAELPVRAADHYFKASDGTKLHGWYFKATEVKGPLLLWCHGNGGNITSRAPIAAELASRGIAVFVFDYRGFGRSEGSPTEAKLYDDSIAAYEYAKQHFNGDIAVYGASLGGPYAAYVAANREVCAAVMDNTFPSLAAEANALYSPLPVGILFPRRMTTVRNLNRARVPTLVVHGRRDEVVPFVLGERLYREIEGAKEMMVSEEAGHSEVAFLEPERYYRTVVGFLSRNCRSFLTGDVPAR